MINISAEDAKLFQDNGFTKEQIGATINHYRQQGLSDEDIQLKINDRLSSFGKATVEEKKGIDLTPRGIGNAIGNALAAPITAKRENVPLKEAFDINAQRTEDFNNEHKLGNAIADFALYAQLPVLKGAQGASALAKGGNFLANAAIQGGLPGLLEGAKEGNALEGAGAGTGIAAGVQSLPIVGKIAKPIMQVVPTTGNLLARTFGRIQPETLERAVQPDSKALDLTREQAQNLLMDTTERIQKDYRNLIDSAGRAVNEASLRLPEERGVFASSLKNSLNDIYSGHSVSGVEGLNPAYDVAGDIYNDLINKIDLASDVKDIGRVSAPKLADIMNNIKNYNIDWNKSNAKERQALLKQIYGDFSRRLGNLSPELRKANKAYSKLAKFDDNEGLKQIINPSVIDGNKIDSASSALRNYNSTVTKGNTNRNIQDLEKLLVANGKQPFLNDIDDVNAAMDLLNARSTGDSWLANLTTQLSRPALKGVRYLNQKGIPEKMANFSNNVSPEIRKLLTPALVQLGVGE
jgi:hypothetical protein